MNDNPTGSWNELERRLLEFGGDRVPYRLEEDLDNLLTRGELWQQTSVRKVHGRPSQCHANIAALWERAQEPRRRKVDIITGYALSPGDGCWRQHTWGWRKSSQHGDGELMESTEPRTVYFGFRLTQDEAEQFAHHNY